MWYRKVEKRGWTENKGETNVKYHEVWSDYYDTLFFGWGGEGGGMFKVFTGEVYLVVDMQQHKCTCMT